MKLRYIWLLILSLEIRAESLSRVSSHSQNGSLISASDHGLVSLLSDSTRLSQNELSQLLSSETLNSSLMQSTEFFSKTSSTSPLSVSSIYVVSLSILLSAVCQDSKCNRDTVELNLGTIDSQNQGQASTHDVSESTNDVEAQELVRSPLSTDSLVNNPSEIAESPSKYMNLSNITNIGLSAGDDDAGSSNTTEDCRFMSFEEWKKKKNLEAQAKASLDAAAEKDAETLNASEKNSQELVVPGESKIEVKKEIEEDQGRTYKDKFNYASSDCAATVVSTNRDAKGASAILKELKDSYLLNKCSTANKFVVIELCQDILVSRVVMGNFELFSSMFKSVKFSVSDRFPATTEWKELGVFEAENIRNVQEFDIENPLIWARYLRIDILSHYGNEFYCPISIVRVHGTTMMEEFKNHDHESSSTVSQVSEDTSISSSEGVLKYPSDFSKEEDECRVVLPYLALNEFLKDLNSTEQYCDVPPTIDESTAISTESAHVKTTEESILKNIVKRLSLLESNASLSLLYVEEQSKLLANAFGSLEKRHASKFESLMQKLNQTVTAQVSFLEATLNNLKSESKQLFDSHDIFSSSVLSTVDQKNGQLARELSFQRKIIVIDTLLLLALLAYVVITKEFLISEEPATVVKETIQTPKIPIKPFAVHSSRKSKGHKKRKGKL